MDTFTLRGFVVNLGPPLGFRFNSFNPLTVAFYTMHIFVDKLLQQTGL